MLYPRSFGEILWWLNNQTDTELNFRMGLLTVELVSGHGYVALVAIASVFVMQGGGIMVGMARRKYDVKYPTMYLPEEHKDAKAFNCVQRAHQNSLENYPGFLAMLFLASLKRPEVAAALGAIRLLGFIVYMREYATGLPDRRIRGQFGLLALLGLIGLAGEVAYDLIAV